MTVKEYIQKKRITKNVFIALHNKDNKWLICDTWDSDRLADYLGYEVIEEDIQGNVNKNIVRLIKINYEPTMSLASIKYKEEQRQATTIVKHTKKTRGGK